VLIGPKLGGDRVTRVRPVDFYIREDPLTTPMPLRLSDSASTLLIRRPAFEKAGLLRSEIDSFLELTDDEFRVEGDVVAIGPVFDSGSLSELVSQLEQRGLVYFEDFFELSGNWPDWLSVFVMAR
jgi:hypothetical protein